MVAGEGRSPRPHWVLCGRIRKVEAGEATVEFTRGSVICFGAVDLVFEVAEVVGFVVALYRGCPLDGH